MRLESIKRIPYQLLLFQATNRSLDHLVGAELDCRWQTVAFVGEPPKRIAISEWESLEKAQAFVNSAAFENLAPQRDKAVKTIRSYAIEGS